MGKIIALAVVFVGAIANAAPCASAVDPVHAYLYPDDDNYAGSGKEVSAKPIRLMAQRKTAADLLDRAAQCRRLAAEIVGDRTSDALIKLAEEFEAQASAYMARGERNVPERRWLRLKPYVRLTKHLSD